MIYTPMKELLKKHIFLLITITLAFLISDAVSPAIKNRLYTQPTGSAREGMYAVFMVNGQAYFGSIAEENDSQIVMTGIYYLQSKVGPKDDVTNPSETSLLKLGSELHAPEDRMEIERSNVLFVEKLKDDGKVAKAIREYQKK